MSGSSFGKLFKITTFGESHGKALGVIVDGVPAGVSLSEDDIQILLDRRKPGNLKYSTKRKESDSVEILSGVFNSKTIGTPIAMIIFNEDQRSKDYSDIKDIFRPGHADYGFYKKFGIRDYRGGGRSSARETASRVAAGAIAKKILKELNIEISAYTYSIGEISIDKTNFDEKEFQNDLVMPDKIAFEKASKYLDECIKNNDSAGGTVECIIKGLKAGVGEPVFDKLDAILGQALFSIGAVKGVEFGSGFSSTNSTGSENNDEFFYNENNKKVDKKTNNSGGIIGGISDGSDIILKVAFKPTPSISKTQNTINTDNANIEINIKGRHDPIVVPRAVVVVESMVSIVVLDLILQNLSSDINIIRKVYLE